MPRITKTFSVDREEQANALDALAKLKGLRTRSELFRAIADGELKVVSISETTADALYLAATTAVRDKEIRNARMLLDLAGEVADDEILAARIENAKKWSRQWVARAIASIEAQKAFKLITADGTEHIVVYAVSARNGIEIFTHTGARLIPYSEEVQIQSVDSDWNDQAGYKIVYRVDDIRQVSGDIHLEGVINIAGTEWAILSQRVLNLELFLKMALANMPHMVVMQPPELVAAIKERINQGVTEYENPH